MTKIIDFSKSLYELCKDDSQVVEIMKGLGFDKIANPASLNTVGRFMTIPKGAVMKGIDLEKIKKEFADRGYEIKE